MVRLKGGEVVFLVCQVVFQFQCGAIKSLYGGIGKSMLTSFNSNVVRLKGFAQGLPGGLHGFQFQCGAIKR